MLNEITQPKTSVLVTEDSGVNSMRSIALAWDRDLNGWRGSWADLEAATPPKAVELLGTGFAADGERYTRSMSLYDDSGDLLQVYYRRIGADGQPVQTSRLVFHIR